jgi:acyl transferase domain-containing protein/acyl carrier protein
VIKMTMAMRNGKLPRSLHLDAPSPNVEWSAGKVELLHEPVPWLRSQRPRRAAVSSFGVSGTNAHLILEEGPADGSWKGGGASEGGGGIETDVVALPLSARDPRALAAGAARLRARLLGDPDLVPADVAHTLVAGRARLERRAVALGVDREELLEGLAALEEGRPAAGLIQGRAGGGKVAFVFSGQGSQWQGMGAELLDAAPLFAESFRACDRALSAHLDWSLEDVVREAPDAPSLERIEVVQPLLFAAAVSLAALWRAAGVEPDAVMGHSQGEIAAAHVAGALSLEDAAALTVLRSELISKLAGAGAMVSVSAGPDAVAEWLGAFGGRVELAAVNSPSSVVLASDRDSIPGLLAHCEEKGFQAREIPATIPSHSSYVDALRDEVIDALGDLSPRPPKVPFCSSVSGEMTTRPLDAEYWFANLREPVRFEQTTRTLAAYGCRSFVEISAHPVLAGALGETIDSLADGECEEYAVVGSLRRDDGGPRRFLTSLAEAEVHGAGVDWSALSGGGGREHAELPTYPFQRRRFWLEAGAGADGIAAAGQAPVEHPLLSAAIETPGEEGWLFTARLSLQTHPWLADHGFMDVILLPGTAFVELALRAGRECGCEAVEELTLETPLLLPERGAVRLQVAVGPADADGRRSIAIHSRPDDPEDPGRTWARHATGSLSTGGAPAWTPQSWPPSAAAALPVEDLYTRAAELGFSYGAAFQGLRAAWRSGEEIFAEVELDPEQAAAEGAWGIHPALFDAALHTVFLDGREEIGLPFSWQGVCLGEAGASSLRVRAGVEGGLLQIDAVTAAGEPALSVAGISARPVDPARLRAMRTAPDPMYKLEWVPTGEPATAEGEEPARITFVETGDGDDLPALAAASAEQALAAVQEWLADESLAEGRLAVVTHGAVAATPGEEPDLRAAAVWGLLRSAQSELPDRFLLVDLDEDPRSRERLEGVIRGHEETQVALREGKALVPRLVRVEADAEAEGAPPALDPEGTVLVTGGTGGIGAKVARRLVDAHGAKRLLLASRSGAEAEGAGDLRAELEGLGAEVEIAACDVADRESVAALIDSIPVEHPLTAVFHTAGTVDDGVFEALDPKRLRAVMAPKVAGAWHLHELTADLPLSRFVLFSSASGTLGGQAQANYAAANVFLDALAQGRRAQGLTGTSLAWGLWSQASGATADLGEADLSRLRRSGLLDLGDERALGLFDHALASEEPLLVPAGFDLAALRSLATAGLLPPVLRGLAPAPARLRDEGASLVRRLERASGEERGEIVLETVRAQVAAVLGHPSATAVDPRQAFAEMGFDSLGAVELRNRLTQVTGARLQPTIVFDHPTPAALAEYLGSQVLGDGTAGKSEVEELLDRLESTLGSLDEDGERAPEVARRLQALARRLGPERDDDEAATLERIEAASAEEIIGLIDELDDAGGVGSNA